MIPLFSWGNVQRAERVWDGFLRWGRLNEMVIEAMLPAIRETFNHLADRPREWRQTFARRLSTIAVRSVRNPMEDGWLTEFVRLAPAEDRGNWTGAVGFDLNGLDQGGGRSGLGEVGRRVLETPGARHAETLIPERSQGHVLVGA
jgi:hypothetical protein